MRIKTAAFLCAFELFCARSSSTARCARASARIKRFLRARALLLLHTPVLRCALCARARFLRCLRLPHAYAHRAHTCTAHATTAAPATHTYLHHRARCLTIFDNNFTNACYRLPRMARNAAFYRLRLALRTHTAFARARRCHRARLCRATHARACAHTRHFSHAFILYRLPRRDFSFHCSLTHFHHLPACLYLRLFVPLLFHSLSLFLPTFFLLYTL